MEMASASFGKFYLIMNKCDLSIPMKKFGSFFPSHYDVTEIRDLKTNVKKGQFKFEENCNYIMHVIILFAFCLKNKTVKQ